MAIRWPWSPAPRVWSTEHVQVSVCALLQSLAEADGVESPVELATVGAAMKAAWDLTDAQVAAVQANAAADRARFDDPYGYARLLRTELDETQRRGILATMRDLMWADGEVAAQEHGLAMTLGKLLGLPADEVGRTLTRRPDHVPNDRARG